MTPFPKEGIFGSLRQLLATALDIAQVRLELLGNEVELEKRRIFDGLLWGAIGVLVLGLGLVLFCGLLILLFWDGYRIYAVGSMAVLFLGGGFYLLKQAHRRLSNPAGLFSISAEELSRDKAALKPLDAHEKK